MVRSAKLQRVALAGILAILALFATACKAEDRMEGYQYGNIKRSGNTLTATINRGNCPVKAIAVKASKEKNDEAFVITHLDGKKVSEKDMGISLKNIRAGDFLHAAINSGGKLPSCIK